jgi:hypothetical protein
MKTYSYENYICNDPNKELVDLLNEYGQRGLRVISYKEEFDWHWNGLDEENERFHSGWSVLVEQVHEDGTPEGTALFQGSPYIKF